MQPFDNNGFMRIHLTVQSAEALTRVESMRLWEVQPAMTRGRKTASASAKTKTTRKFARRRRKPQYKVGENGVPVLVQRPKKSRKKGAKKEKPKVLTEDPTAKDFRRSSKGSKLIREMLKDFRELDCWAFASSPIFDHSGQCRMKYPPAADVTFQDIVENGPACVEMLPLRSHGSSFTNNTLCDSLFVC